MVSQRRSAGRHANPGPRPSRYPYPPPQRGRIGGIGETPAVPDCYGAHRPQPIFATHGRQLMSGVVTSSTLGPAALAATMIVFAGEPPAVAQSALPAPAFHHLHLNALDPDGAIA